MEKQEQRPNKHLRRERELRGWSQRTVASAIGTTEQVVTRWESGQHKPNRNFQTELCRLFGKSAEELGFMREPLLDKQEVQFDQVNLADPETKCLSPSRTDHLQTWLIDSIEDGTHLRWQLYYTSRNTLTNDGLRNQIMKLEFLMGERRKDQERICRVLAQNYQLAGSLARDTFQYTSAKDYFQKAQKIINSDESPDMAATSVARSALVYLRQSPHYSHKALQLYKDAAQIALHAMPHVRAYILSGLAEAYARNGEKDACYHTLDDAELYFHRSQQVPVEEDIAYVGLTLQSLEDARGECYVLLGEVEKGLHALQSAQEHLDQKSSRNHCRLLMQHAEAFFAGEQPDHCVQYTLEGLQLARQLESVSNVHWSYEIYDKLLASVWNNEHAVKQLGEALKG